MFSCRIPTHGDRQDGCDCDKHSTGSRSDGEPDAYFVGRYRLREKIKTDITRNVGSKRLIQLSGPPMIGKTRLCTQVLSELQEEALDNKIPNFCTTFVKIVDAETLTHTKSQILKTLRLGNDTSDENFDFALNTLTDDVKKVYHIFAFDGCEHISQNTNVKDEFINMIYTILDSSRNFIVITTSQVQFSFTRFAQLHQEIVPVPPLTEEESIQLLLYLTPDVPITNVTCKTIVTLCHFLPYTILFIGRVLQDYEQLTADEVVEILQGDSFEGFEDTLDSDLDKPSYIIQRQIQSLGKHLKSIASVYAYFPATFSEQAAQFIGGFSKSSQLKTQVLLPLQRRNFIEFNKESRRYTMHSILRDYLNKNADILDMYNTRRRFSEYFGDLLVNVNEKMSVSSLQKVLCDVKDDWPNIEHLLSEALHCHDIDVYSLYMKICHEAGYFIQKFIPQKSLEFFTAMLEHAQLLDHHADVAVILCCLASTMANSTRKSYKESVRLLKQARSHIPAGFQLKKLLSSLGWMYYQMGKIAKAAQCQREAINVIVKDTPAYRATYLDVKVKSHLAISEVFMSNFSESRHILHQTMDIAQKYTPYHPQINVMLNTFGLNFNRSGDLEKALKYYRMSLAARRQTENLQSLIIPLNNVAYCLMDLHKYEEGIPCLEEALMIQQNLGTVGQTLALTKRNLARCQYNLGRIELALKHYTESHDLYMSVSPRHYALGCIQMERANCYRSLGDVSEASLICQQVINENENYYSEDNTGELDEALKEAYDMVISFHDNDPDKQDDYRMKLEVNLSRIADKYKTNGDITKSNYFRDAVIRSQTARLARIKQAVLKGFCVNASAANTIPCNIPILNGLCLDVDKPNATEPPINQGNVRNIEEEICSRNISSSLYYHIPPLSHDTKTGNNCLNDLSKSTVMHAINGRTDEEVDDNRNKVFDLTANLNTDTSVCVEKDNCTVKDLSVLLSDATQTNVTNNL